jgi:hypothetical protein
VPANPNNLTAIWPKYAVKDWHYDLDPEIYRQTAYPGVGADITRLKSIMGWIDNPSAWFDKNNNLLVTWLDYDYLNQACTVDVATQGQLYGLFARFSLDQANAWLRKVTIPSTNFSPNTAYDVRINCEFQQPILHVKSN